MPFVTTACTLNSFHLRHSKHKTKMANKIVVNVDLASDEKAQLEEENKLLNNKATPEVKKDTIHLFLTAFSGMLNN